MDHHPTEYPNSDEIEPEVAKFLYEHHCAVLIIEELPCGSEFGFDLASFRTGEKFKGVKMIPPGVHFVFASAVDNTGQCGPRSGFFHNFRTKEILVKRWSVLDEDFDDSFAPSDECLRRYKDNLKDLDRYLGAYRYSTHKTYLNLTNKMTPNLTNNLMPECNRIRSVPYLEDSAEISQSKRIKRKTLRDESTSKPTEDTLLPNLRPATKSLIKFTEIPCDHLNAKQEVSFDMISQYHLDTTTKLEQTFEGETGRAKLLGEFQFAFITLVLGHVYECFEHWRQLLGLVCLADSGLNKFPVFYRDFVVILTHQLEQIPEDLFEDISDCNNLVRSHVDTFLQNVEQYETIDENMRELNEESKKLRHFLETKFHWQFGLELEDEQPVIVEL